MIQPNSEEFVLKLQAAFAEGDLTGASSLCTDGTNENILKENPWEIIPTITEHITDNNVLDNKELLSTCLELLKVVSSKCAADDVVLVLHKEIHTKDETKFTHLLEQLKHNLIKIPLTKPKYFVWCFDAIQSFVNALPLPDDYNLEGNERILMDADADVHRISAIYLKIYEFYDKIFDIFRSNPLQMIVVKYILQLLGQPIVHLDLSICNSNKSRARRIAENFVLKIVSIYDPMKFIKWKKYQKCFDEDFEVRKIAIANFLYLVLSEKICDIPKVYNPIFVFQNGLYYVIELFLNEHQFIIQKCLSLSENLLTIIKEPLHYSLLDDPVHCHFCTGLSQIIIFHPLISYRQKALGIFKDYLFKFDDRGRWLIIYNIFNNCNHSSLQGYLVTQYKVMLVEELDNDKVGEYFCGPKMINFINMCCSLPKQEESDLVVLADQIIPSLNLLRYLVIRDKENITGIWTNLPMLQKNYLEPLKKGLIMSKAHYDFKIKELEEEAAKGDKKEIVSKVSVSIAGENLPNMTVVEKMNVLKKSMTALDVIESLLARLNECFAQNVK